MQTISSAASSVPSSFILQSYNAFNTRIALHPDQIINNLNDFRTAPIPDAHIVSQTSEQSFFATSKESSSAEETQTAFAASVGIEGSYGFFSGSVQANYSHETDQSATSYNFGFNATIDCGNTYYFRQDDIASIRSCLVNQLLVDLDAIGNLTQAAAFTEKYGTHLIIGVALGGALYVSVRAATSSISSKNELGVAVKLSYGGISSMSATATANDTMSTKYQAEDFEYTIQTIGGSSSAAAKMDAKQPSTYAAWSETCTIETVSGVSASKPFSMLASNPTAGQHLELYLQLRVLIQSITYPSYFSNATALQPYQENKVSISPAAPFKVISGGATVNVGSSNFLTACYPDVDSGGKVTGWVAASHDVADPSKPATDTLTAYAIAIHDPANLLKVSLVTSQGSNPGRGADSASASLAQAGSYVLAGGGAQSATQDGSRPKFLLQSLPAADQTWAGTIHDYDDAASNVLLTVYAIGVYCEYLTIIPQTSEMVIHDAEYGNAVATVPTAIAGGGVRIDYLSGSGNLLQQNFPSSAKTWTTYDKDTADHKSYANSSAFAIQLTATLNG